ncbi:alpha/beta hydrolase [Saccharothrix violaceirubra]|uniref:Alpha-beta hydrolase superfamily lysophospholipase n=1 Tax=Saccharothrix violaceirubra TaxID=413306 RepID=A0A7W7SZU0_9PSEU|nr:alpha/beta hydrolase [Saccharothrix violaceirubra]MBB4963997.1 alpha-beta hydrolase superfamily lysophospholipase [Saccharothrix violaceirubra]
MTVDVLGDDYETRTLPLGGGDVTATLVRKRAEHPVRGAVLYVHGFADYFFQRHVAEHFTRRSFDFYAVDLRAYGRSLRPGQLANHVTDLTEHFEEIDASVRIVREEDGHRDVVLMGHSTGGLTASLWAHERRRDGLIDALVLNSPWLDLAEPWFLRTVGTAVIRGVGRFAPRLVVRSGLGSVYGQSIHRDHHGEWDFDLGWKPIEAFPVTAGWLRAVRRAHATLHRGLDVRVPVLLLRSAHSHLHARKWSVEAMTSDTVLDVEHMRRWGPKIGRDVTVVTVDNGMHDLFLSAEPVRRRALAEVDEFLDGV